MRRHKIAFFVSAIFAQSTGFLIAEKSFCSEVFLCFTRFLFRSQPLIVGWLESGKFLGVLGEESWEKFEF